MVLGTHPQPEKVDQKHRSRLLPGKHPRNTHLILRRASALKGAVTRSKPSRYLCETEICADRVIPELVHFIGESNARAHERDLLILPRALSTMLRQALRRTSCSLLVSGPDYRREFATKTLFTAQALVKGGRADGDVTSDDGNLKLTLGLPKAMGGPGKHTNPEQLFAAGYAACFQGAIGVAAKNNKAPVKGSSINSHVSLRQDDNGKLTIAVDFDIKLDGVDKATAEKVIKDAHQICPYSNATRGNIDFKYTVL